MAARLRQRWLDLPIVTKGLAVIAPPLIALLVTVVFFAITAARSREAHDLVAHTLQVKAQIATVFNLTVAEEASVNAFVFARDDATLQQYRDALPLMPIASRTLRALAADNPEQLDHLRRIRELAAPRAMTRLLERAQREAVPSGDPMVAESAREVDAIRRQLSAMQDAEDRLLAQRVAATRRADERMLLIIALAAAFGVASGLLGGVAFTSGISWRIGRVRQSAANLALGLKPLPLIPSHDEIGDLHRQVHDASALLAARDDDVRRHVADLAAVNQELEAFSYSVSHDLRAPLRHVTGFAALLESSAAAKLDEQDRRYLRTVSDAARRMGRLIDDLLAFSRMGRASLDRCTISLDAIVREARQDVDVVDERRDVVWNIQPLPDVEADPSMLRLVFTNLLSNAVKYSATRTRAQIDIGVCGGEPGETVIFVRDNGVGFDMQYVHKLFGVFQRLHSADEFDGTGIGLANVRRIVSRHGGRVWATAVVDGGATFFVALPTAQREAA